ncbi:hypothetical protein CL622_07570 [archaeon]|nr:hypothetical protein [archaeon]|tara:strand:- start:33 stop:368 length:336 start_codon:yes stop_codon:yes gene_type:complete
MKLVKKVHPKRRAEGTAIPTKEGPNDYQYYRSYDNGWHISVVCNYAVRNYEEGDFEVAVWCYDQSSRYWQKGIMVLGTQLDFEEVATLIYEFKKNPEMCTKKRYIEIESGI